MIKPKFSANARLLFIIDNDFGALGLVMYLLFRQPLAARSTILLPAEYYKLHGKELSVKTRSYQSLQDILDVVENDPPDLVCLFSGYILTTHKLLTSRELEKLVSALQLRNCQLATSDPYMGTFRDSMIAASNSVTLGRRASGLVRFIRNHLLRRHVRRVAGCLEGISHVIAVPHVKSESNSSNYVSFFNSNYIRDADELRRISTVVDKFPDVDSTKPRWLFVLARFDLELQQHIHGRQGFADIVAGKLQEGLDNNRQPTLIAPAEFITAVSPGLAKNSAVNLLSFCPFEEFEQRLLDAEVVFYWQFYSTSTFLRLMHGLPVFYFDPGHSSRLSEQFHETCLAHYYLADQPILLDVCEQLNATRLTKLASGFKQSALEFCRKLSSLPTPTEMVDKIVSNSGADVKSDR